MSNLLRSQECADNGEGLVEDGGKLDGILQEVDEMFLLQIFAQLWVLSCGRFGILKSRHYNFQRFYHTDCVQDLD
jgi:hypothetical protein